MKKLLPLLMAAICMGCNHDYSHRHPTEDPTLPTELQVDAPTGAKALSEADTQEFSGLMNALNSRVNWLAVAENRFGSNESILPLSFQLFLTYNAATSDLQPFQLKCKVANEASPGGESINNVGEKSKRWSRHTLNGESCPLTATRAEETMRRILSSDGLSYIHYSNKIHAVPKDEDQQITLALKGPLRQNSEARSLYLTGEVTLTELSRDFKINLTCQIKSISTDRLLDHVKVSDTAYDCQLGNLLTGHSFTFRGHNKKTDQASTLAAHWLGGKSYSADEWNAFAPGFLADQW